jgi:transposase-like protein
MSKGSWKLRGLAAEAAEAVRTSSSLRMAARKIGVSPSTLTRAVKAGRLPAPGRPRRDPAVTPPVPPAAGSAFAEWAHATYTFTHAEGELVDLAQTALDLARDTALPAAVRLTAMAQYRACLRDLKLPDEDDDAKAQTAPRPRRWGPAIA